MQTIWTTAGDADPRLLRTFPVPPADAVAVAEAGLITGESEEPGVRIWHPSTGQLLQHLPDVDGRLLLAAGATAVVCGWSDTPQLVDLGSGAASPLPGHRDIVQALVLADPQTVISAAWDGLIRLTHPGTRSARDLDTGDRLNTVAVLTRDDRRVVLAAGHDLHAFDFDTGERLPPPPPASGRVERIVTWPGSWAVCTAGGSVELPGERLLSVPPRRNVLDLLALSAPDGRRLLAVVGHEDVTVWDVEGDRPYGPPLVGPTSWPGACLGPDGSLITVSPVDGRLAIWRPSDGGAEPPRGHSSTIGCLAIASAGRIVAGGSDGVVGSWSPADGARGPAVGRTAAPTRAVAVVESQVLAGGGDVNADQDDNLHRWPGTPIHAGHRGEVKSIAVAGPTTVLTSGCDVTVALIDVATGTHLGAVPGETWPSAIAVRDGRAAITRFPGAFQLWDLAAAREIPTPATDATEIGERVIGWAGPGRIVTVLEEVARVRDLETGFAVVLDPGNDSPITAIAAADSVAVVAVAREDGSLSLADPNTGRIRESAALPYAATAMVWTPDGRLVVACRRDLYLMA